MKVKYICSDVIKSMTREDIVLDIPTTEDAYTTKTWEKVKKRFARRNRTKADYVNITGIEQVKE